MTADDEQRRRDADAAAERLRLLETLRRLLTELETETRRKLQPRHCGGGADDATR